MRAVKPLDTDGYTKNDYVAYVSQSYTITSGSLTNTEYVTIDFADQPYDNWKYQTRSEFDLGYYNETTGIYSYPLFSFLNYAFYSSQSIVNYGTDPIVANKFTPSGSLYVFNIANQSVCDGIKPGSFAIAVDGSSPILDDSYGRLYVGSPDNVVGNIFYNHGFAIVQNNKSAPTQSISVNGLSLKPYLSVNVSYLIGTKVTEHTIVCKLKPTEFNTSIFNNTIGYYKTVTGSYVSGSQTVAYKNYVPNISSSATALSGEPLSGLFDSGSLTPYVTTIGLYNNNYELLAIAKLANPVPRAKNVDQTFIVKFDT